MSPQHNIYKTDDGTSYQYDGSRDNPAIILIHGLGLCRKIWAPFITALSHAYYVITYDLYGHGDSGAAPAQPSLSLFARQIAGVMDHAKISSADIIGFSIGGMINRRFAMDFPDHCKKLVILNSPHHRGDIGQAQVEARAAKVRDEGKMATLPAALERWFTPSFRKDHPDALRDVEHWRQITDDESYAGSAWVLANGVIELINPEPAINKQSLVMTSEHDSGSTPEMSHAIAREIKESHTIIIPTLQHLGLIEDPHAFIKPIKHFLEG